MAQAGELLACLGSPGLGLKSQFHPCGQGPETSPCADEATRRAAACRATSVPPGSDVCAGGGRALGRRGLLPSRQRACWRSEGCGDGQGCHLTPCGQPGAGAKFVPGQVLRTGDRNQSSHHQRSVMDRGRRGSEPLQRSLRRAGWLPGVLDICTRKERILLNVKQGWVSWRRGGGRCSRSKEQHEQRLRGSSRKDDRELGAIQART